jgi:hypothetical protein
MERKFLFMASDSNADGYHAGRKSTERYALIQLDQKKLMEEKPGSES